MDCSECNLFDSYKSNTVNIMNLINNCGWFSYFLMSYPCEALLLYKSEHNVIFVFFHHSPFFSMVYIPDPNRSLCSFDCYCYFRRVENSKVADRVFIWSSINNIIKFWKKFKQNQNNPYAKITIFFLMLLMTILHVPSFPFLVLLQKYWSQTYAYQTVKSMIPFFYQDLSVLISKIMKIIVKLKSSVWLKCCYQSEKNWFRKAKLFNDKDVNIGFGTSKMLLDLPKKIWLKEHIKFLKDSKHFNISSLKESLLIHL